MKVLYFEPYSGASGDMILGAFADLGVDFENIKKFLEEKINVTIKINKKIKNNIVAIKINVIDNDSNNINKKIKYTELVSIIKNLKLDSNIEEWVLKIFSILGRAESKVHDLPIDQLYIHEIGQKDAIVDIVGSCIALKEIFNRYSISFENIVSEPINTGYGTIKCVHGIQNIPTPATLEMIKSNNNLLVFSNENSKNVELLTPTGAAILSYFTKFSKVKIEKFKNSPKKLISLGYGAGNYDLLYQSNILRLSIYDINNDTNLIVDDKEEIEILETNIDNCTGEIMGSLIHKLIINGAKDAFFIPIFMKKNRPAYLLSVITEISKSKDLADIIMKDTGTLGIRILPTKHRYKANRYIKNMVYY